MADVSVFQIVCRLEYLYTWYTHAFVTRIDSDMRASVQSGQCALRKQRNKLVRGPIRPDEHITLHGLVDGLLVTG